MPAFTPGPWFCGGLVDIYGSNPKGGVIPVARMRSMVNQRHYFGWSVDEAKSIQAANSRLITEAPNLYEAIQNLLGYANKAFNEAVEAGNKTKANHIAEDIRNTMNILKRIDGREDNGHDTDA